MLKKNVEEASKTEIYLRKFIEALARRCSV